MMRKGSYASILQLSNSVYKVSSRVGLHHTTLKAERGALLHLWIHIFFRFTPIHQLNQLPDWSPRFTSSSCLAGTGIVGCAETKIRLGSTNWKAWDARRQREKGLSSTRELYWETLETLGDIWNLAQRGQFHFFILAPSNWIHKSVGLVIVGSINGLEVTLRRKRLRHPSLFPKEVSLFPQYKWGQARLAY